MVHCWARQHLREQLGGGSLLLLVAVGVQLGAAPRPAVAPCHHRNVHSFGQALIQHVLLQHKRLGPGLSASRLLRFLKPAQNTKKERFLSGGSSKYHEREDIQDMQYASGILSSTIRQLRRCLCNACLRSNRLETKCKATTQGEPGTAHLVLWAAALGGGFNGLVLPVDSRGVKT